MKWKKLHLLLGNQISQQNVDLLKKSRNKMNEFDLSLI